MYLRLFVALAILAISFAESPKESKVTAAIKDTIVNGIEGFNVNIAAPFKFQDYIVGFKYALGDIKKAPESLFVRRSFDTFGEGSATVDADYNVADNCLDLDVEWTHDDLGLTLSCNGDTTDKMKRVGAKKSVDVDDNKLWLKAAFDIPKKLWSGSVKFEADQATVEVEGDSENRDPLLTVTKAIDDNNEIIPAISLKTGKLTYGYKRKWAGGSVEGVLTPGDKVDLTWEDDGANGLWTTKAEIPLEDASQSKVSITRDWNY
mmetsp:Transcript_103737/g.292630  ORF Transcript_103737/g.292630 Transcript_103737/m.292630 type:complete len:262 (-) Transcript_103737:64-849(-)|eukprot:CAMPEP_0117460284 /NCGR_PEP_ID=MMETSP0784-20121206/1923_1 /TAXON_ID=39447 /ORGANISM="" /LENGTH=261 /DNA_ID=CAMNT_0005253941 /DNA_START=40 /DNA_END=825 /DNA_ORIENTATION=+